MFWTLHLIGWLSPHCLVLFLEFWFFSHLGHISLFCNTCYIIWGGALCICQGRAIHFPALWCYMWRKGQKRNNAPQLLFGLQSLPPLPTNKLGPSCADFWVGGFVCVLGPCRSLQWTLLWDGEFLPPPPPPQVFTAKGLEALVYQHWKPGLCSQSCSAFVLPSISMSAATLPTRSIALRHPLCPSCPSWPQLPISDPPISPDECFFFNSFVVGLP